MKTLLLGPMLLMGSYVTKASIPDSLYLQLVDSVLSDLGSMDAVHPVLGYLKHSEKQVYNHAEGIQVRIKAQHNARKLPRDDYYVIMELMFEIHPEEHHDHADADGPLLRHAERDMGVDAEWRLGRMKANVQVAGKGNERLVQRMVEQVEKRFKAFRERHGLPSPYMAIHHLPQQDTDIARYLVNRMEGLEVGGQKADRMDRVVAAYEDHEERRLGLVWNQAESHRVNMELTLWDEQDPAQNLNTLLEQEAFLFRTLHLRHIGLRVNVATTPGSTLGPVIHEIIEYYQPKATPSSG